MSFNILQQYKTLVFDCDGVVLNSNKVKTDAFYEVALPFGEQAAQAFVAYHTTNGGISRYKKFVHFLQTIVPQHAQTVTGPGLEELLDAYASLVRRSLLNCEIAPSLQALREKHANTRWLIVSGGDQAELREVFAKRNLAHLFDGGIFGSPDSKDNLLERELASGNIDRPALFLGDSKYDYEAATQVGLDFVFLYDWTEVKDWREWTALKNIVAHKNVAELGL